MAVDFASMDDMIRRGQDPTEADKLYKLEKELLGIQATVAKTMEDVFIDLDCFDCLDADSLALSSLDLR